MGKTAFVFPGQGAQFVGMGKDIYDQFPASRELFQRADEVLGFGLSDIIFNGPVSELTLTYHAQPALLATSLAYYEAYKEQGISPDYAAGHSLGEYTALVAAGVLRFEDAVKTVHLRGKYMHEAVPAGRGTMAAVLGAEREALDKLCREISAGVGPVELANINCPGQIVISGSVEGVQAVGERGKEIGAKRVIPLEVSGPFHSSYMKPAADRLAETLSGLPTAEPAIPVVANVTARTAGDAAEVRRLLTQQVYSPVLWEDSVRWLIAQGVNTFVEIGPGNVLAGLIKKIDRGVQIISVNSAEAAGVQSN